MAHAATSADDSKFLNARAPLSFRIDPYRYEVTASAKDFVYAASNGTASVSALLTWAFGSGEAGQTFVYKKDETFYESRLSYYTTPQTLDFTAGHPRTAPPSLDSALGKAMDVGEARLCFGCHTTGSTTGSRFDPDRATLGVTCEACHGPGMEHVATMNLAQGDRGPTMILNPAGLAPVDSVEFCGACHRAKWDVVLSGAKGILNVRFQPYRLEGSRCFGEGDPRITCIACHDPHTPLVHDLVSYDKQCLSCHQAKGTLKPTRDHPGKACPVREKDCVTCHMPKLNVPEMHRDFTDHRIRVVRANQPFPD